MDAERFDRAVRLLGRQRSRRGFVGLVAGLVGALPLAADAAFRPRPDGVVCGRNAECASGYCAPKDASGRRLCAPADPCAGFSGPDGSMTCAGDGAGFCTIDHGVGVFRNCAPGTACRDLGQGQIICDWPT